MIVQAPAKYLNSEARSFTNDQGQVIDFYRINVLELPELNPMTLSLSRDCFMGGMPFDKLEDVILTLEIVQRGQNGIRVTVANVQAA